MARRGRHALGPAQGDGRLGVRSRRFRSSRRLGRQGGVRRTGSRSRAASGAWSSRLVMPGRAGGDGAAHAGRPTRRSSRGRPAPAAQPRLTGPTSVGRRRAGHSPTPPRRLLPGGHSGRARSAGPSRPCSRYRYEGHSALRNACADLQPNPLASSHRIDDACLPRGIGPTPRVCTSEDGPLVDGLQAPKERSRQWSSGSTRRAAAWCQARGVCVRAGSSRSEHQRRPFR